MARKRKTAGRRRSLRYVPDQGRLTRAQMDAINRLQPPGRGKVVKTLFS